VDGFCFDHLRRRLYSLHFSNCASAAFRANLRNARNYFA
jgi:hypothetical protein